MAAVGQRWASGAEGPAAFEEGKPNLRPAKSGKKHGALKKGAKKVAFISKEVSTSPNSPKDFRDEQDLLGVVNPGTLYSLNKKGRWRAGEVLSESLGAMQEGGVEVSGLEMESGAPGQGAQRVKVLHSMRPPVDRGVGADPSAAGDEWDAGLSGQSVRSGAAPPLTSSDDRAHLRYTIFHPTASEKHRTKEVRKVLKETGEVYCGRTNRQRKGLGLGVGEGRQDNPFDSETFGEGPRVAAVQTEDVSEERRRTLSLGDFLPDDLRQGLDGLASTALPPDDDDDDWELLNTPDLDDLDFDRAK